MLSLLPDAGHRSPSTAGTRRGRAVGALALVTAALSLCRHPSFAASTEAQTTPSTIRRAAISDTLLASEIDGTLYLEVLAEKGDTAKSLAASYATSAAAATAFRTANDGAEPKAG